MSFAGKANYTGHFDSSGIPMLDYRGRIGLQYNPIAVAQWGLGNYDLFKQTGEPLRLDRATLAAGWLVRELAPNTHGLPVWAHHFNWSYRDELRAPWHSGLAQGQGISLLTRVYAETGDKRYAQAANTAFEAMDTVIDEGGVKFIDNADDVWIEEYIVAPPPTHILNGFIWALWGVRDHHLTFDDKRSGDLWRAGVLTVARNLQRFDDGAWSLYDLSSTGWLKMVASSFYHRLHIVQLRVMFNLTGMDVFENYADRWEAYAARRRNRVTSLARKTAFKLLKY